MRQAQLCQRSLSLSLIPTNNQFRKFSFIFNAHEKNKTFFLLSQSTYVSRLQPVWLRCLMKLPLLGKCIIVAVQMFVKQPYSCFAVFIEVSVKSNKKLYIHCVCERAHESTTNFSPSSPSLLRFFG